MYTVENISYSRLEMIPFSDLSDFLQSIIILHEECQILKRHVHITVTSLLLVFLHSRSTSRESILVDLKSRSQNFLYYQKWKYPVQCFFFSSFFASPIICNMPSTFKFSFFFWRAITLRSQLNKKKKRIEYAPVSNINKDRFLHKQAECSQDI